MKAGMGIQGHALPPTKKKTYRTGKKFGHSRATGNLPRTGYMIRASIQ